MLLDGHHLDAVVTCSLHAGQHVILEFYVCTHALTLLGHTHMALVYEQRILFGFEILMFENVSLAGIPYLGREYLGTAVLHHPAAPCRNTVTLTAVPFDAHLVMLSVANHTERDE